MGEAPEKVKDGEREQPAGGAEAVPPETAGAADGGSTVHLRVRDVDSATTFLRVPEPEPEPEPEEPAESKAQAVDPRLAIRDGESAEDETGDDADAADDEADAADDEADAADEEAKAEAESETESDTADESDEESEESEESVAPAAEEESEKEPVDASKDGSTEEETDEQDESEDEPEGKSEGESAAESDEESEDEADDESPKIAAPSGDTTSTQAPLATPATAGAPKGVFGPAPDLDEEPPAAKPDAERTMMLASPAAKPAKPGVEPDAKPESKPDAERTMLLAAPAAKPATEPDAKPESKPDAERTMLLAAPAAPDTKRTVLSSPAPSPAAKAAKPAPKPAPAPSAAATPAAQSQPVPQPVSAAQPQPQPAPAAPRVPPVRRALRGAVLWGLVAVLVIGALVAAQLLRPLPAPKLQLSAPTSYTFTGDPVVLPWPTKGQAAAEVIGLGPLGSSGPDHHPVPIASVTKVMTAYLVLQKHPLKRGESGPTITVDKAAAQEANDPDQSSAKVVEGQQLSEYEALELLMLPSANNIARLLARWEAAGSEQDFVKQMNQQAAAFGMVDTTYADPAGYNFTGTKSTAKDQLKLGEQVMGNEVFREIVSEKSTIIANNVIKNTNELIDPKTGVIGVKTGSSNPSLSCLMWAATKEVGGTQQLLLGVTLGQPTTATDDIIKAAQTVSSKIITAGQSAVTGKTLVKQGEQVGSVSDGLGGQVPLVAAKDLVVPGFTGVATTVAYQPSGSLGHTAAAGTQVGVLTAGSGPGQVQVPVVLQRDLAPPSILSRLSRLG
ncbi:hypothetical protein [Kitasatospora acidiphila]|uniref:hypothetical protein n=1 Tax=Kitasatospora acidiphila TaxID=2567942 RepID=UPI003C7755CF